MKPPGTETPSRARVVGDESGVALIMVLLVTVLLFGLSFALSTNTMLEVEVTSNHERELLAFYAAQTGLERAIDGFRTNYTTSTIPSDSAVLFDNTELTYTGSRQGSYYSVRVQRRDAAVGSPIYPFPVHYTILSTGTHSPTGSSSRQTRVTLSQTLSVSPRSLANYTLFYDQFDGALAFQSTFRLAGRLAVNDTRGVQTYADTTVNGDFYSAGAISRSSPFGVPKVSGNIVENGGKIDFPNTIDPFAAGAEAAYTFTGTSRFVFQNNGQVLIYNSAIAGGSKTVSLPASGIISVRGGDAIVEGTVHGRVTVACDRDILINGGVRYADQTANSWDTLALVAQGDVVIPEYYYTGTTGAGLTDFNATWNSGHWQASSITGGTWGSRVPANTYIDGTLVSLTGSSPTVINPGGRPAGELYIYGNSISKIASVTVYMNGAQVRNGLNENYTENKKLDLVPPPGFPLYTRLLPTFFTFREVRTPLK